jgi:hypothetical protein
MTTKSSAALTVEFLLPVSFGFQPKTPGFEATLDAEGKVHSNHSMDFAAGDTFTVPAEEHDEFQKLIDLGYCKEA